MASKTPSVFQYIHSIRHSTRYRNFDIDPDAPFPKESQFAYHLLATIEDEDLFNHWATEATNGPAEFLRPAIALNPLATPEQLDQLLRGSKPARTTLSYVAKHPNTDGQTLDRLLELLTPHDVMVWHIYTHIAEHSNVATAHARRLLHYNLPMVNAALAANPRVPEDIRIMAGLAA